MKITEDAIDYNVVQIIDELTSSCYDMIANDDNHLIEERGFVLMTIGEIQGVCDLARALKEALKA